MAPTVVILGSGPAGVMSAHKLLKHTVPKVSGLKIILVTPSTHFYWNPASVRAVIPGEYDESKLFVPLSDGFGRFPKAQFELVTGAARAVDTAANTVQIQMVADGSTRTINYDQLVVATGASMAGGDDLPMRVLGSYQETVDNLHALQKRISDTSTKSIVIGGAGSTGVETAAELGQKYGQDKSKTVTLVTGGARSLPALSDSVAKVAESTLTRLGVTIVRNARVEEVRDGQVHLSTGKKLPADVYLPLYGVKPNTSFLPAELLDTDKNLMLGADLRVKGLKNVWGVGDVGNLDVKQVAPLDSEVNTLWQNLDTVLTGNSTMAMKEHKASGKIMLFVSLGKAAGTGQFGGWKVPSFVVTMMKSKTLMPDKPRMLVEGKGMFMGSI